MGRLDNTGMWVVGYDVFVELRLGVVNALCSCSQRLGIRRGRTWDLLVADSSRGVR